MTQGDKSPRVRPIEYIPTDAPSTTSSHGLEPDTETKRTRAWLALSLSALVVLIAVSSVAVLGALEFNDPEPPGPREFASGAQLDAEAPPDTLPPRLEESVPGITDRLTLVSGEVGGPVQTLVWDPSFRVPKSFDLPIGVDKEDEDIRAIFDSGGRTLAVGMPTLVGAAVYVGDPSDIGESPDIIGATSWVWHATEIGSLAWIAPADDGHVALHTGTVDPLSGSITEVTEVVALDEATDILRWDSSGFVLNREDVVAALDPTGGAVWVRQGTAPVASASILLVYGEDPVAGMFIDRLTGELVDDSVIDISLDPDAFVTMSRNTDLVAVVSAFDGNTRILVDGPGIATKRIIRIDGTLTDTAGFSSSGEYLLFQAGGSNDIVFVDWRTGATHTLPIPDEWLIFGMDLG